MVLFLHNRYRTTGGEERVVEDLLWLVRERLRRARRAARARLGRASGAARAALGLLRGGLAARRGRARRARQRRARRACAQPAPGVRLARARRRAGGRRARGAAPAPVPSRVRDRRVLHARRGVHALPRAQHAARRAPELPRQRAPRRSPTAPSLALWQRRLVEQADAVVVPSAFARERLRELGAPLPWERVHVLAPPVRALAGHAVRDRRRGRRRR